MTDPMPGGFVNDVTRLGDTVRRPLPERADFIHGLLRYFERMSWAGAPCFIDIDDDGHQILSYLDGHVAWSADQPADVWSDESLSTAACLVRAFHDLTAGTELAGTSDVVCHNDLSPRNTVYRDTGAGYRPVAFIDWDLAAPGERIHDVAHMCWQFANLRPAETDVDEAARRMRVLCDGYGLHDRSEVVATVLWWQDRCWRGIEAQADAGVASMVRLRDSGAVAAVHGAFEWTARHRTTLERHLV